MNHLIIAATLGLATWVGAHAQQSAGAAPPDIRSGVVAPLLDDAGIPLVPAPWTIPSHSEHRTHGGLYATEAQAVEHERSLPGRVISVRAGCCGEQGLNEAMLSAWDQYVRFDASKTMPVLVRGSDPQQAARLADRLTDASFAPVFLVTVP